jgi:predicted AAA+ superfamily ATPase
MVKRELYLNKIKNLIDKDIIKVITGIRRCGKTYMLNLIIDELRNRGIKKENIFYITFESSQYNQINNDLELTELIKKLTQNIQGRIYLLFDEIQLVKNWERSINSFRVDYDCDIYITGSNSNLLSSELATLLTGRYMEIKMYPFSFNETLDYYKEEKNIEITKETEKEIFKDYITYGGLPFTLKLDKEDKINYLQDVYNSIILKDIINRYEIRNIDMLERLILFLIENIGNSFSANSISKYMKNEKRNISVETITNYLNYFINAFILTKVSREDLIGKKLLTINEKYYLINTGFYKTFIGNNKNQGKLLENIVFNELILRGYNVTVGKVNNLEIDFICKKQDQKYYIQVSQSIMDENTLKREFKPLMEIKDFYPKYILTLDDWNYSSDGIIHMNIIDFLKKGIN